MHLIEMLRARMGRFFLSKQIDIQIRPVMVFLVFAVVSTLIYGGTHFILNGTITGEYWEICLLMGKTAGIVALFLLACAFGSTLLQAINIRAVSGPLEWAISLGLGLAALSLGTFFIAVMQQANLYAVAGMLFLILYFSRQELLRLCALLLQKRIRLSCSTETWWLWILWTFILSMFIFEFILNTATVLRADYDAFHQYLTFPMEYLKHGGFTTFLWHPSWGFPQLGEMLFLLTAIMFGHSGPFLANYGLMLILITIIFQAMNTAKPSPVRHWLTACIASSPTLLALGSGALKIEMAFYVYCLLLLVVARDLIAQDHLVSFKDWRVSMLCGIFLGILLSIKYTAFFVALAFFLAAWMVSQKKIAFFKRAFGVLGVAFLVMSPWLIKNWVVYKSLLYPITPGQDQLFLETGKICSQYFKQYATHDVILGFSKEIHQFGLPIVDNLQIFFFSIIRVHLSESMLFPGVWVAICLSIAVLACSHWKSIDTYGGFLLLFMFLFFVGWSFSLLGGMWYLFPIWLALALFVSERTLNAPTKRILMAVAICSVLIGWFSSWHSSTTAIYWDSKHLSTPELMAITRAGGASMPAYEQINDLLQSDVSAKIYSFQDPLGYFINDSSKRFVLDYYGEKIRCLGNNAEVKQSLKDLGVKYILADIHRKHLCENMPNSERNEICRSIDRFESFIEEASLPIIYAKDDVTLYQL